MRYYALVRALLFQVLFCNVLAANIRSIFLFKDVLKSNTTAIKTSGFNSLIMFGVGVLDNGDISKNPRENVPISCMNCVAGLGLRSA